MDQYANPDSAAKAAARVAPFVADYAARYGPGEPVDATIGDLIADLLHLADRAHRDGSAEGGGNAVLDRACTDYDGETPDDDGPGYVRACPVCSVDLADDDDVVNAHLDAEHAHEGYGPPRSHPAWGLV